MGANIDAIATAAKFGIDADHTSNFNADKKGLDVTFSSMNEFVANVRNQKVFTTSWKSSVDEDFINRKK